MTDLLVVNTELAILALSIATLAVGLLLFLAIVVGHWLAWRHYDRNKLQWANEDVRRQYHAATMQNAELTESNRVKDREIARLHHIIDSRDALIKGALTQATQTTAILTKTL